MEAFVAVADEIGLPEDVGSYPKISIGIALAQRRWREHKSHILKQTGRAALGGALAMALVANLQLIPTALMTPDDFRQNLELTSLPLWIFSNALLGILWGGLLGAAIGFTVRFADSMWQGKNNGRWRFTLGALAGVVHAFFLILLPLAEGFNSTAEAAIFIPVYLVYGLLTGGALTWVIPSSGVHWRTRDRLMRVIYSTGFIAIIALPTVYLVYQDEMVSAIVLHLLVAFFFPLGLAVTMARIKESPIVNGRLAEAG